MHRYVHTLLPHIPREMTKTRHSYSGCKRYNGAFRPKVKVQFLAFPDYIKSQRNVMNMDTDSHLLVPGEANYANDANCCLLSAVFVL